MRKLPCLQSSKLKWHQDKKSESDKWPKSHLFQFGCMKINDESKARLICSNCTHSLCPLCPYEDGRAHRLPTWPVLSSVWWIIPSCSGNRTVNHWRGSRWWARAVSRCHYLQRKQSMLHQKQHLLWVLNHWEEKTCPKRIYKNIKQ